MRNLRGNPWAVLVALCLGFFMTLLDTTVVGVAVPDIVERLGTTYNEVLWVSNSYVLVLAVLLIPGGKLGDLLGKRNTYLAGVAVFSAASLLCALAQTPGQLIAARTLQGLGAALLIPQTMSIIIGTFPPQRRGAALGVWGAVAGLATIAGPPLGGFLVGALDWRWIFTINVPLGVLVLVIAPLIIPAGARPPRTGRFDLRGALLVVLGLCCLTFGLQEGQRYDWGAVWSFVSIPLLLVAGVLLLVVFAFSQRRPGPRAPMVPFELLRNRNFGLMNVGAIGLSVGIMSMAIGFQLYAQSVLGYSALAAGLISLPMSAISVVLGPYAGRLSDKLGGKPVVVTGLLLFGLGLLAFSLTSTVDSTAGTLLPAMLVMGVGLGATFAPLTTVAMHDVQPVVAGSAAGVLNATRQIGSVLGTAGFGVLLQNQLVGNLLARAETAAAALPAEVRGEFVDGVRRATSSGVDFADLQAGTAVPIPSGISPALAQQVEAAAREVFTGGYVAAMHSAMVLPIGAVLIGAICALLAKGRTALAAKPGERNAMSGATR
ncbi:drug resistance transporter, EmrB/QacA subfamily [Saccharopolyspora antimicrobica]|uniref:Drug resistance transporter, EmrB/QacA subfamily n=1 Tax=Saccharopolyspora antimicrobica TaxID=455193 RepID=A0A1I5KY18_9PSEU|nr:MFS transporter [Saccharopolyspora antimicrobica]RKT89085.1 EmrB/QacA subfamily drug resistance transporter [Saccharopolyspora antimicrobica]SFO90000.1 drug resistance transporter, EmrB/QacA subfamily [Saccharopolyspora antimicrobica]